MENDRDILLLSIFTFLTISLWIFFELVKTSRTSTIEAPAQEIVKPIPTKINAGILELLEKRNIYR